MSLLWLLPIEKIPAKFGGPALVVIGMLGLLTNPWWGGCTAAFGLGICVCAVLKRRKEAL